jgi:tetratricopeptide (TPR) repeat protein
VAALHEAGRVARQAGRSAAAAASFQEALRLDPGFVPARVALGEMALERGAASEALVHLLQALREEPVPGIRLACARAYALAGRGADALALYREILEGDPWHLGALRALRDTLAAEGRWAEALPVQERLLTLALQAEPGPGGPAGGAGEDLAAEREREWLAGLHYEAGRARLRAGEVAPAILALREALRVDPGFVPAALALGDAHLGAGDAAQARRVWERALERVPALPLLARLEYLHRTENRPTQMIALYQRALARAPEDLALGHVLGRVYLELSMLDEAAEQFQKIEVRAPDLPGIHAYLGLIAERRGDPLAACADYRRALALTASFDWPHRCAGCGAGHPRWADRCTACRRWNTLRP